MDLPVFLTDYTLRTVSLGAAILGSVSGALGTFAFLRRQSLIGDAISHAALPGIALAFLLTGSKAPLVLLIGAALSGWLGMIFVLQVVNLTRIKEDSALGLVLSVFFGFRLVLLTFIHSLIVELMVMVGMGLREIMIILFLVVLLIIIQVMVGTLTFY